MKHETLKTININYTVYNWLISL